MLRAIPAFREFHWLGEVARGVSTAPVVERFDVVEQVGFRVGPPTVAGVRWRV